jgi:hypothetical protein
MGLIVHQNAQNDQNNAQTANDQNNAQTAVLRHVVSSTYSTELLKNAGNLYQSRLRRQPEQVRHNNASRTMHPSDAQIALVCMILSSKMV